MKKGYFFTLDVFIALGILLVGLAIIFSYSPLTPPQSQAAFSAYDILNEIASLKIIETDIPYIQLLVENGTITNRDNTLLEQIGEFYITHQYDLASNFSAQVIANFIPPQYGAMLIINDTIIYESQPFSNESPMVIAAKRLLSGIINNTQMWGPLKAELRVWRVRGTVVEQTPPLISTCDYDLNCEWPETCWTCDYDCDCPNASISIWFVSPPTDPDAAIVERNWTYMKVNISNTTKIDTVKLNWDGTNMSLDYRTRIDRPNLTGLWHFNDDILDSSQYHNEVYGGSNCSTEVVGKFGSACHFNGSQYINVSGSGSLNINGSFTIEAWVKPDGLPAASNTYAGIVTKSVFGSIVTCYTLRIYTLPAGRTRFQFGISYQYGTGTPHGNVWGTTTPIAGNWYHLAAVFNGTNLSLYVNGIIDNSTLYPYSGVYQLPAQPVFIGALNANAATPQSYFNGTIDEVRIWNYSKSPAEIWDSYTELKELISPSNDEGYYINLTNQNWVTHLYYAWANQSDGNYSYSEPFNAYDRRIIIMQKEGPPLAISFVPPTPDTPATVYGNWIYANLSVRNTSPIDTVAINWNGTNVTVYGKNLLGLWHFNGDAKDSSQYNNPYNASPGVNCSSSIPGYLGSGCYFNSSGYINVSGGGSLNFNKSFTIEAWTWLNADSGGANAKTIVSKYYGLGARAFSLYVYTGKYRLFMCWDSACTSYTSLYSTQSAPTNQWVHVAAVYNLTNITLFINGEYNISVGYIADMPSLPNQYLQIGAFNTNSGRWNGTIDELRIWNYSKSATEIKAGYQAEIGKYYAKFTHLPYGNYTFYAWANDSVGNYAQTETRTATTASPLDILFTPPTAPNNTITQNDSYYINVSVQSGYGVSAVLAYWNGTNVTIDSPNLVGLWHLNNNTNDSSRYKNNGAMVRANCSSKVEGYLGSGCRFNGANQYIEISDASEKNLDNLNEVTVEAWIKPNVVTQFKYIVSNGGAWGYSGYALLLKDAGGIRWESINPCDCDSANCPIATGQWTHIAATWKTGTPGEQYIYVNGQFKLKCTFAGNLGDNDRLTRIGRSPNNGENTYFDGIIDEVRIWNYSRTGAEINASYRAEISGHANDPIYYVNFSHQQPPLKRGDYLYYVWANDTVGNAVQTETRNISINAPVLPLAVNFVPNTPVDDAKIADTGMYINISTNTEVQIDTVKLNWNGTNITIDSPNLVGVWHFNNDTNDSSRYKNNGIAYGAPDCSKDSDGYLGTACYFNGSNYINISDSASLNISVPITIEAWIRRDFMSVGGMAVVSKMNSSHTSFAMRLMYEVATNRFYLGYTFNDSSTGKGYMYYEPQLPLASDKWYYVAITNNGTHIRCYMNGTLTETDITTATPIKTKAPVLIGKYINNFNGSIDEVRIWNYSKTPEEIKASYNAEFSKYQQGIYSMYRRDDQPFGYVGGYTYSAWANDSFGRNGWTETRNVSIEPPAPPMFLIFISPTQATGTTTQKYSYPVNFSVYWNKNPIDTAKVSWNETNVTVDSPSLVGLWHGNGNGLDSSRYHNDGTLGNGADCTVAGYFGNGCYFDSDNNYIDIGAGTGLNLTSAFTIQAWVKVTPNGDKQRIVSRRFPGGDWSFTNYDLDVLTSNVAQIEMVDTNNQIKVAQGTTNVADNKWHHLAGIFNGTHLYIYTDGNLEQSPTSCSFPPKMGTRTTIGADAQDTNANNVNGIIDEVRIWNRSLSDAEIKTSYRAELSGHANDPVYYASFYHQQPAEKNGTYKYYAWINDSSGATDSTEIRNITIAPPICGEGGTLSICFTGPTEADGASVSKNWTYINSIIVNTYRLKKVMVEWNGTNVTIYGKDLLGMWHLDGGSPVDSSQYANPTVSYTATCPGTAACYFRSCCEWTGAQSIEISGAASGSLNFDKNFTIEAWTKKDPTGGNVIVSKYYVSAYAYFLEVNPSGQLYWFKICADGVNCASTQNLYSTAPAPITWKWIHVAGVFNGTHTAIFFDGVFNNSVASAVSTIALVPGSNFEIGAYAGTMNPWKGWIDEVRVWNYSKSAAEIKVSYNAYFGNNTNIYFMNQTNLARGTYTYKYRVRVEDINGNKATTEERTITLT